MTRVTEVCIFRSGLTVVALEARLDITPSLWDGDRKMFGRMLAGAIMAVMLGGSAMALDGKAYEGTWSAQFSDGTPVSMTIPAGVTSGAAVTYYCKNQDQGPQTPTVQGNKIRLDNPSGTYILIGPVKGNHLPFFWTNGTNKANLILTKQ